MLKVLLKVRGENNEGGTAVKSGKTVHLDFWWWSCELHMNTLCGNTAYGEWTLKIKPTLLSSYHLGPLTAVLTICIVA